MQENVETKVKIEEKDKSKVNYKAQINKNVLGMRLVLK